jgi:hypothetical protein
LLGATQSQAPKLLDFSFLCPLDTDLKYLVPSVEPHKLTLQTSKEVTFRELFFSPTSHWHFRVTVFKTELAIFPPPSSHTTPGICPIHDHHWATTTFRESA